MKRVIGLFIAIAGLALATDALAQEAKQRPFVSRSNTCLTVHTESEGVDTTVTGQSAYELAVQRLVRAHMSQFVTAPEDPLECQPRQKPGSREWLNPRYMYSLDVYIDTTYVGWPSRPRFEMVVLSTKHSTYLPVRAAAVEGMDLRDEITQAFIRLIQEVAADR